MNPGTRDAGYTLVALLVVMTVGAILLATIAPTWGHLVRLDKEEELKFRGQSYAFAIERHLQEFNRLPGRLEDLVERKMIRRLYQDPITSGPFELLVFDGAKRIRESELTASQQKAIRGEMTGTSNLGIIGVVSTSEEKALRPLDGKEYYNEWEFYYEQNQQGSGRDDSEESDTGDGEESVRTPERPQ